MKAILTKHLGSTTYKPSRVVATDEDGNRATVSWLSELDANGNHRAAARALCQRMNWHGEMIETDRLQNGATIGRLFVWAADKRVRF